MKRTMTGLCIAAAFGFVASLGAQSSTTTTASGQNSNDMTITGCLERGANGNYVLANAQTDNSMDRSGGSSATGTTTTGTTGTTGTSGTTSGTTATGSAAGTTADHMNAMNSWTLEGGQDLDKHVGHKVQVTGREASSSSMNHSGSATGTTSSGTTGTTSGTTATGTTSGTTGTTGSGSAYSSGHGTASGRTLDVKSVKMISSSCS